MHINLKTNKMKTTKELIIEDITVKVEAKLASQNVKLGTIDANIKEIGLLVDKNIKVINQAEKEVQNLSNSINSLVLNENIYKELIKQKKDLADLGVPIYAELVFALENFEIVKEVIQNTKSAMKKAVEIIAFAKKGYDI